MTDITQLRNHITQLQERTSNANSISELAFITDELTDDNPNSIHSLANVLNGQQHAKGESIVAQLKNAYGLVRQRYFQTDNFYCYNFFVWGEDIDQDKFTDVLAEAFGEQSSVITVYQNSFDFDFLNEDYMYKVLMFEEVHIPSEKSAYIRDSEFNKEYFDDYQTAIASFLETMLEHVEALASYIEQLDYVEEHLEDVLEDAVISAIEDNELEDFDV
jgi:coenzyme F420-reducing hydrogenase alpha subunit